MGKKGQEEKTKDEDHGIKMSKTGKTIETMERVGYVEKEREKGEERSKG